MGLFQQPRQNMFTGIIEGVGTVRALTRKGDGAAIEIACDFDLERTNIGDSISVNGCCLTVTSRLGRMFWADIAPETFAVTTMGMLAVGAPVNLERALKMGERLGGHIVQGHIDGIGTVLKIERRSAATEATIGVPPELMRYLVERGSVAIDGVSLTVMQCREHSFSVSIIPHTRLKTTFTTLKAGDKVNLEVDIIGKYVEKLTFLDSETYGDKNSKITEEFLKKHGF